MKIRKARKEDLNQHLELKREWFKEYSKLIGESIKFSKKGSTKIFNDNLKNPQTIMLVAEGKDQIIGYLWGRMTIYIYKKTGYFDDVFVRKEFRGKKIGTSLIKDFISIMKKKGVKRFRLGVSIRNKDALKFYKKLGFKLTHYEMEMKLK